MKIQSESEGRAVFVVHSMPGVRVTPSSAVETMLDQNYLGEGYIQSNKYSVQIKETKRHCVRCYRSSGTISPTSKSHLRFYFVHLPKFKNPNPIETETRLEEVCHSEFLTTVPEKVKDIVREMIKEQVDRLAPVIHVTDGENATEKLLLISYRSGSTHSFFSAISSL